jgi:L-amino acid N-acyltransferase YncA
LIVIDIMTPCHWKAVKKIYEEGIATGNATFQQTAPTWEEWNRDHLHHSRLIAKEDDLVVGWAALIPVSGRCVYAGVAEESVYIAQKTRGKGIGKLLLQNLIKESEANNIWTLQAGIFRENIASLTIHKDCGFRIVGIREKIGSMHGRWRDVVLLERRSTTIGIE